MKKISIRFDTLLKNWRLVKYKMSDRFIPKRLTMMILKCKKSVCERVYKIKFHFYSNLSAGSNYSPRKVFEGLQFQAEIVQILFWTKIGARVLHHSPRNISVVMIGLVSSSGFSESFHKYLNNVRWANKTDRVRPLGLSIRYLVSTSIDPSYVTFNVN